MKKFVTFFLVLFFITNVLLAAQECSKCKFKNEDSDRYCINCSCELRPLTEEEKERFRKIKDEVKAKTIKTHYETNAMNQYTKISDSTGKETSLKYDKCGNLIQEKDNRGNIKNYNYDPEGHLIGFSASNAQKIKN